MVQKVLPSLDQKLVPKRHLFVRNTKKGVRRLSFKSKGFVNVVPRSYFTFLKQNGEILEGKKINDFVKSAFGSLPIDIIVAVGRKKSRVYRRKGVSGFRAKSISGRQKKQKITDWYYKELAFDGIVLDRRGNFLLIQGLKPLKKNIQAVSIVNSRRVFNNARDAKANSLIQLVNNRGSLGVFEILILDEKSSSIKSELRFF